MPLHVKIVRISLLAGIAALALAQSISSSLADKTKSAPLTVAVDPANPPFSFVDHEDFHGIDVKIAKVLADKLNTRVDFILKGGSSGKPGQGPDIIMGTVGFAENDRSAQNPPTVAPTAKNAVHIPYFNERLAVLPLETNDKKPSHTQKIGVVAGSLAAAALKERDEGTKNTVLATQTEQRQIVEYPTFAAAFEATRSEELTHYFGSISQIFLIAKSITKPSRPIDPSDLGLPDGSWPVNVTILTPNIEQTTQIQSAVAEMIATGEIDRVFLDQGLPMSIFTKKSLNRPVSPN